MSGDEALAKLRLARTDGVGPKTFRRLLERHGSAHAALRALPDLSARRATPFLPPLPSAAEKEFREISEMGGSFLFFGAPDYPPMLAQLEDAPSALAVVGDTQLLAKPQIAVVGARNASALGRRVAMELSNSLVQAGFVVTSGLARGIDGAAHAGALRSGSTIAIVPGGLDRAYPPEHAELQSSIAERGAVVAEAPLGTAPLARHFPKRNRIIAGLSLGVVVIEAGLHSGTLMTARLALEAGREIFAVPGSPLDPRCTGSNDLIRQGAYLTESVADILDHLPQYLPSNPASRQAASPVRPTDGDSVSGTDTDKVLSLVGASPVTVDEVMRHCHLSAAAVQAILLDLELDGRIDTLPGNRVIRSGSR
ncbi:DNA-processing protein DprA [Pseudoroseomonas globiformis]|uniref:DNA-processing protein DprA n=1 Tax=Teichococcus globiformis TaxID=2307229 RepID=A0ABV7FZF3_9PROT